MAASTQGVSNGTQQAQGRLLPEGAVTKKQGDVLIGVMCMLLTLCLAAVGGRLLARRMVKASLEADDYLAVGALVGKTSVDALIGTTLKPPSSSGHARSAWN